MNRLFILLLLLSSTPSSAQEVVIPTVVIGRKSSDIKPSVDSYSVFKVEKVAKEKLSEPSRQNLNDVVKDQVGVDSQAYCANCGAKRLTINGLKGEHTSILVDGLPLHSAVSSFYGVDNIPTNGLSEVQVMRGAGASLANPEAIGGTLNLITVDPLDTPNSYSTSIGVDDDISGKSQNHSLLYGWKTKDKKMGVLVGGQFTRAEAWDIDDNNVSEFPERENYSLMSKARVLWGDKNDFTFRVGKSHLEILGGYLNPVKPKEVRSLAAQESDFIEGNVEKEFVGDPQRITDWVDIDRTEGAATGTHYLSENLTYEWRLGYARQAQDAIYQHGFDYANIDNLFAGDTNLKFFTKSNSTYTLGAFFKDQRLRSASQSLFEKYPEGDSRDIKKDSFNFASYALYGQYSYFIPEILEVDLALRVDHLKINWIDLVNKIEKPVIAPRVQILHYLTHDLKQRFSYGLGYRAPLTFFESQHGNNESGYEVDIEELEKSHSLVYSLSLNKPSYYITASGHYTRLKSMAYGFESFNQPIQYKNSEEDYDIWVTDLLLGLKPKSWWLLEASAELFQYEEAYKRKLPTAAIEQRYQIKSRINKGAWSHSFLFNLIGGRDLSKYGSYNEHYVNRNQAAEPVLDTSLDLKNQRAPTFFTIDTALSYKFNKRFTLNFGVKNLLNYTQTGEGDSPATWHWHFNHGHFDGLHTWGPNTGRQYYLSVSGQI